MKKQTQKRQVIALSHSHKLYVSELEFEPGEYDSRACTYCKWLSMNPEANCQSLVPAPAIY